MNDVRILAKELQLTVFSVEKTDENMRWSQVNHTDTRFWLKTENGKPLDEARLAEIERKMGDQVAWIGPVYENTQKGRQSCFCPIPNVVLLPKGKGTRIVSSVTKIARQYGLNLDENRSKYLISFYYLQVPEGSKTGEAAAGLSSVFWMRVAI